jgi:hypothetical protein
MIGLTKEMIGLAAVFAFGFVGADQVVSSHINATPALSETPGTFEDSTVDFVKLNQQAKTVLDQLIERQEANARERGEANRARCQEQTWPYYSADCLSAVTGSVREPSRVVGVERHLLPAASRAVVEAKTTESAKLASGGWSSCTTQAWPYHAADCPVEVSATVVWPLYAADAVRPIQHTAPQVTRIAALDGIVSQ